MFSATIFAIAEPLEMELGLWGRKDERREEDEPVSGADDGDLVFTRVAVRHLLSVLLLLLRGGGGCRSCGGGCGESALHQAESALCCCGSCGGEDSGCRSGRHFGGEKKGGTDKTCNTPCCDKA